MITNRPPYGIGQTAYAGLVAAGAPELPDQNHTYRVRYECGSEGVVRVEVRRDLPYGGSALLSAGRADIANALCPLTATVGAAREAYAKAFEVAA